MLFLNLPASHIPFILYRTYWNSCVHVFFQLFIDIVRDRYYFINLYSFTLYCIITVYFRGWYYFQPTWVILASRQTNLLILLKPHFYLVTYSFIKFWLLLCDWMYVSYLLYSLCVWLKIYSHVWLNWVVPYTFSDSFRFFSFCALLWMYSNVILVLDLLSFRYLLTRFKSIIDYEGSRDIFTPTKFWIHLTLLDVLIVNHTVWHNVKAML